MMFITTGYNMSSESVSAKKEDASATTTTYHRIIEALKFAYAKRANLGDESFVDVSEASHQCCRIHNSRRLTDYFYNYNACCPDCEKHD
mgnify:CR=1 FL=1